MRVVLWLCRIAAACLITLFLAFAVMLSPQLFGIRIFQMPDDALCYVTHTAADTYVPGQEVLVELNGSYAVCTLEVVGEDAVKIVQDAEAGALPKDAIQGEAAYRLPRGAEILRVMTSPTTLIASGAVAVLSILGMALLPRRIYKPKYGRGRHEAQQ